ncbi:hypothetical protein ABZ504_39225, partial [Streptomyces mirabilis]
MTDDQHGEGTPRTRGRWDPLPQGDYDDGATAFVKLPEGGIDALLAERETPLAAPGHGYLEARFTEFDDFLRELADRRTEVYEAFAARKQ